MGAQLAQISARAGGRPVDRQAQVKAAAAWIALAVIPAILVRHLGDLTSLWVVPAAAAAGWLLVFGLITAKEYTEEADMMWFHWMRDLRQWRQNRRHPTRP